MFIQVKTGEHSGWVGIHYNLGVDTASNPGAGSPMPLLLPRLNLRNELVRVIYGGNSVR